MLINLLSLRFIQAQRIFKSLGFLYGLFVLIIYSLILYRLFYNNDFETHQISTFVYVSLIFLIHFGRNDKKFLSHLYGQNLVKTFAIEYSILLLSFTFPLLFGEFKIGFLISHISVIFIAFFNSKLPLSISPNRLILNFIPKNMFEWRSGMRKNQFIFIILYLMAFGIGLKYGQAFIIIGLITFIFASFYNDAEPLNFLLIGHNSAKSFIDNKLKTHLKWYLIFVLPIVLFFLIKYPQLLLFYIPIFIIYILNFLVFILNKYKSYIPNKLNNSNTVIILLLFAGVFLPFLFPISLILVFVYYHKSIKNLNQYFNAENQ